jgi:hypothetical protein
MNPVEITVSKYLLERRGLRPGNYYECTGPDGTRFDNTNIKTLRAVLAKRYGRVTVKVVWGK